MLLFKKIYHKKVGIQNNTIIIIIYLVTINITLPNKFMIHN